MAKLGRNYLLTVETLDGGTLIIQPPFTIEFDITRTTLSSANVCSVRIFNLSLNNRNNIRKNVNDNSIYRAISLRAGYGDNLPVIFQGNISQAWSVREGVNFITQIECFDGGFAFVNGQSDVTFPANTDQKTIIASIMGDLPKVSTAAIGNFLGSTSRGKSYSGNSADILREITGGAFFVDNEKAYVLKNNEYVNDVPTLLINKSSGLLNTPVLEASIVRFEMIFEPQILVGRRILLESITESNFNGYYIVTSVKHRGMISEAVCGDLVTTGEFFFDKILTPVSLL